MSLRFCAPFPLLCFFLHSAAPFAIFIYELWPLERVFVRLAANFFLQRPQDAAFEHGHYGHQCDCARTRAYTPNIFNVQVLTCCRHLAFSLLSFVLLVAEATDFFSTVASGFCDDLYCARHGTLTHAHRSVFEQKNAINL